MENSMLSILTQGGSMASIKRWSVISLCLVASCGSAFAQAPSAAPDVAQLDRYTPQELTEKAQTLKQQAEQSGTGSASVVLEKYSGHFTMLAFRNRSGGAELHKNYADIDVVIDGTCTLVFGGTIPDAKTTGPGEVRGASVQGGESTILHKGDILHIPANVPHQMLLPPGGTLTYFVIKVLEPPQP
jgi:mannose-6-phosphate isomerase-like protein (cupin superfamily)